MGLFSGGIIMVRIFASDGWGGDLFSGRGGLLSEFYGNINKTKFSELSFWHFSKLDLFVDAGCHENLSTVNFLVYDRRVHEKAVCI